MLLSQSKLEANNEEGKLETDNEEGIDTAATISSDDEEEDTNISFIGVETKGLTEDTGVGYLSKRGKLDPIFRADPLSRKEKLILRQNALKSRKASHFNVGEYMINVGESFEDVGVLNMLFDVVTYFRSRLGIFYVSIVRVQGMRTFEVIR